MSAKSEKWEKCFIKFRLRGNPYGKPSRPETLISLGVNDIRSKVR